MIGDTMTDSYINLDADYIHFTFSSFPEAFSIDGGRRWRAIKDDTFDLRWLQRLLKKDLTLHVSDKPINRKTKRHPTDAVIVTFSTINKRPRAPRLVINYKIAADPIGETHGDWMLTERGGSTAVKESIRIMQLPSLGYGQFFPGETNGIPVEPLRDGKPHRTPYLIRTAPQPPTQPGGAYTAASRTRRINAMSQQRAPNYRIKNNTIRVRANTYVTISGETTHYTAKGTVDVSAVTGDIVIWQGATARRPASAKQTITRQ
jgi:hypothetical protein